MSKNSANKRPGLVRRVLRSSFSIKKWVSYDETASNLKNVGNMFGKLVSQSKTPQNDKKINDRQESYEEAVARMSLTPEFLAKRQKTFLQSAILYFIFGILLGGYFFICLHEFKILTSSIVLLLAVLMFTMAYREHFWYMQMHEKKLGCNFQDWLAFVLRRKHHAQNV